MRVETQIEKEEPSIWSFLRSLPTKSFKITKPLRITLVMVFLLFVSIVGSSPGGEVPASAQTVTMNAELTYTNLVRERAHTQLINEVKRITYKIVPDTPLDLEYLVKKCEEYEMDIIFVLAQGILESHLGTKGKAAETNSVWNVGTYDDGQILYQYNHPNESIDPYMKLVNERYLVDKDLHNLVQDRGYINVNGKRFASARGYENGLRKLMVRIDMESSINLYQEIRLLSDIEIVTFFGPPNTEINDSQLQAMN